MKTVFIFLCVCNILFAESYALVVTVGNYKNTSKLVGAHQDNIIYRQILKRWNVTNIVSLEDSEATKKNIVYHLNSMSKKIQKGDLFYMFFSGHGSSLYDEAYSMKFQQAGLTQSLRDSGVIFPYDFNPNDISRTIIIGKRDLRPYLEKIDAKISFGVIMFDACYSEASIRGDQEKTLINRTPNILTDNRGYPYENIIYVASSITKAQSGKFSVILETCMSEKFNIEKLKECLNEKMDKSLQIPVVLSK